MPKKSSSKKPPPLPGNHVMKDNRPPPSARKPGNEIDEIFSTKKRKEAEQEKAGKEVENDSAKANKLKKRKRKRTEPKEKKYLDPPTQPREKTEDGFPVYTSEELGLVKSDAGGMEDNGETVFMRWNREVDKCFLDTCIQEVTKKGRRGGSLYPESWTTIMEVLNENHNFVVSQRQMKNRYDYLKRKNQAWLTLTTSHVYDHRTNRINMTKSEWQEYIKTHPKEAKEAKALKHSPLLYPELCTTLFEGSIVTSVNALGPCCRDQDLDITSNSQNVEQLGNKDIEVDEHEGSSNISHSKDQGIEETGDTVFTKWNREVDKCFLETCIREVTKRGRRGGSLYMQSWTTIMEFLKENHNFVVSQKQMKNRYDYLKRKYQAWLTLKNKDVYDNRTNTFNMTNSEWQEYIKAHPKEAKDAKALKHAPLLYPELCATLFEGTIVAGVDASGPNCRDEVLCVTYSPSNSRNDEQLDNEDTQVDEHEGNSIPYNSQDQDLGITSFPSNSRNVDQLENGDIQVYEHEGNSNPSDSGTHKKASVPPSQRVKPENKKKYRPSSSQTKLEEAMSNAFSRVVKNQRGPSVTDCITELDKVGWVKEDDLYVSAIVIFGNSAGHREAWMNLPKDNVTLLTCWIKKVGQIMGLTF